MDSLPLHLWDLPEGAVARLINRSENETYLVEAAGFRAILRKHRRGYHSLAAIESELAWMAALQRDTGIPTPRAINGRNGQPVQVLTGTPPQYLVLFEFIEGAHPQAQENLVADFERLGALAARTHAHARSWTKPGGFTRLSWDLETVFGPDAPWGDWRAAPNVTNDIRRILERAQRTVTHRLNAFGRAADRFGLIHADMRLANLLVQDEQTRLIDFDDCGFGWFLYDFATTISFMETRPEVEALKAAWIRGYRRHHPLSEAEVFEIDSFIMLRRFALLAWIGSHMESTEPQALAPHFAKGTAELARAYLLKMTGPDASAEGPKGVAP